MPYFKKENILFIHIPKTGGTSVERFFSKTTPNNIALMGHEKGSDITLQHTPYETLMKDKKEFISPDAKIITIVRNPYERIMSDLFYLKKINIHSTKKEVLHKIEEYVRENSDNHGIPQYVFLKGVPKVLIMHTETLTEDMHRLGYKEFNAHYNANKTKVNYYDYLNDESIRFINKYYDKDFKFFNYKKITFKLKELKHLVFHK
jgi:hypothetical protein